MSIGAFPSAWRNSVMHLYIICTSMSNAFLSNCSSAATCHTTIKFNGILVEMFSLYFYTTNIRALFVSQHNRIGGINFIALIVTFSTHIAANENGEDSICDQHEIFSPLAFSPSYYFFFFLHSPLSF